VAGDSRFPRDTPVGAIDAVFDAARAAIAAKDECVRLMNIGKERGSVKGFPEANEAWHASFEELREAITNYDQVIDTTATVILARGRRYEAPNGKTYLVSKNEHCVEQWPECQDGTYNPLCCRYPKACSCDEYEEVK
jgi:hypothetical protein